jgi:hypothetical protein
VLTRILPIAAASLALTPATAAASSVFSGVTSQGGPDYAVGFRVAGDQVKDFHISWRARCVGEQSIFLSTDQGSAAITIRRGRWSTHGSYRATLPFTKGTTGRFIVHQNIGHVTGGGHARGSFNVRVTLYLNGHEIDNCNSGRVTWSAARGR